MQNGICPKKLSYWVCVSLVVLTGLSSCGKKPAENRALTLGEEITTPPTGCQADSAIRDRLWNSLYREAATYTNLPKSIRTTDHPTGVVKVYGELYTDIITAIESSEESPSKFAHPEERRQHLLKRLAELELGDRTTSQKSIEQDRIEARFSLLEKMNAAECPAPDPTSEPEPTDINADSVSLFEEFRQNYAPAVYGAYKIMSVGYQSCSLLDIAPLTSSTPWVEGIEVVGTHPAGGKQREVTSASDVLKTNPYYSVGRMTPTGACLPEQENPLIYDFGGKPYVSSNTSMEFDLFRNGGSGTAALGIDCSGLVSGALLASGLKLKKTASAKAYQVSGVSSSMLMDPAGNGLSCLSRRSTIQPGDTLLPGDIIAQSGHVVMVDQVGTDPFGISRITKIEDCTTTNLPSSRFSFSILQSSPSLGGIGMNRFTAASYLGGNTSMRNGLVEYAVAHCKAKFGTTAPLSSSVTAALIRHIGGTLCTDQRVGVKYSSCMKDCATRGSRSLASVPTLRDRNPASHTEGLRRNL